MADIEYSQSYDAVMLITIGPYIPMVIGLEDYGYLKILRNAIGQLKPKGLLLIMFREEGVSEFFPHYNQVYPKEQVESFLESYRMKLLIREAITLARPPVSGAIIGRLIKNQHFWILQKC